MMEESGLNYETSGSFFLKCPANLILIMSVAAPGKTVIHVKIVRKVFKNEQSQEVDHSFVPKTQLVNHV